MLGIVGKNTTAEDPGAESREIIAQNAWERLPAIVWIDLKFDYLAVVAFAVVGRVGIVLRRNHALEHIVGVMPVTNRRPNVVVTQPQFSTAIAVGHPAPRRQEREGHVLVVWLAGVVPVEVCTDQADPIAPDERQGRVILKVVEGVGSQKQAIVRRGTPEPRARRHPHGKVFADAIGILGTYHQLPVADVHILASDVLNFDPFVVGLLAEVKEIDAEFLVGGRRGIQTDGHVQVHLRGTTDGILSVVAWNRDGECLVLAVSSHGCKVRNRIWWREKVIIQSRQKQPACGIILRQWIDVRWRNQTIGSRASNRIVPPIVTPVRIQWVCIERIAWRADNGLL